MAQEAVKQERSLGELFSELAGETGTLVRQEIALAQVELTHKATRVGTSVGSLAVGGAIGYAGFLAILAGIIIGLGDLIGHMWLSALIVGAVVAAVAYFMVSSALTKLKNTELTPTETVDSIKEDAKWLKNQVS